jgi:hypothetical protein
MPAAAGLLLAAALAQPGVAAAASDSADTSIPVDAVTQLQMHTTANCVIADGRCYFTAHANLMTPDGRPASPTICGRARPSRCGRRTATCDRKPSTARRPALRGKPRVPIRTRAVEDVHVDQRRTDLRDLLRRRPGRAVPGRRRFRAHRLDRRTDEDRRRLHRVLTDPGGLRRAQPHLAERLQPDSLLRLSRRAPPRAEPTKWRVLLALSRPYVRLGEKEGENQRGRPKSRSPARVSRICSEPPAIVRQRVLRKSCTLGSNTSPASSDSPIRNSARFCR